MADPAELLDVYDEQGAWVRTATRDIVHRDGLWHRCFHLWVVSGDGVLLQRRGASKASWPGRLDATAAGHVGAGESVGDGGAREVREELGVAYAPGELLPLGVRAIADHSGPGVNREFQHVHVVSDSRPLSAWTELEWGELDGLVRVGLGAFTALVHDGVPARAQAWDGSAVADVVVAPDEVLPARYLRPLTVMLERFARGERPLAI